MKPHFSADTATSVTHRSAYAANTQTRDAHCGGGGLTAAQFVVGVLPRQRASGRKWDSKTRAREVDHSHSAEIVIDKQLQQEGNVRLVGLKHAPHNRATAQQVDLSDASVKTKPVS